MDIVDIFNSALPSNYTNLYKYTPENKFYDIYFIVRDKYKIKIFNNIANVIFFLESICNIDNEINEEILINSIRELKILIHGYRKTKGMKVSSDSTCGQSLQGTTEFNTENTINIRYYYYLELIYTLLLKFKMQCSNMDYHINIIDLRNHFLSWKLYFNKIYTLYPFLKSINSRNLFLDDVIE